MNFNLNLAFKILFVAGLVAGLLTAWLISLFL
jgi:hypothetical protein